jgi:uncharacterized DUF497 family protein
MHFAPGHAHVEHNRQTKEWPINGTREKTPNLSKHGIDFADAIAIFDGPTLETVDRRRDYEEERIAAIGMANGIELFVVYTMRDRNRLDFSPPSQQT